MAVAQHPNTPEHEAATAHRLGRLLMLREGLTDADLVPTPAMRYNADPGAVYERQYRPTTPNAPNTPGRKWTVYERAAAASAGDGWGGLHVRITFVSKDGDIADLLRRYGGSIS
jgi:hypothetical protein